MEASSSPWPLAAVEEAHHALDQGQFRSGRPVQEQGGDALRTAEVRVQVAAGAAVSRSEW
ncbi:hypothetical protein GCM10020221_13970 [Streptomyces thioluteus]|uniref:Uncharacterized protein n=1 Tax=Streptomyces thioluteus TaxID=66431 RepID=A0ABP6J2Z1_STRTU